MKKIKIAISLIFLLSFCFAISTYASEDYAHEISGAEYVKSNASNNNYVYYWASTVKSYLYDNGDGTFTRLQASDIDKKIYIETYNSNYEVTNSKTINYALTLFGGFYNGENYNFIVTGQTNPNEDNNLTVIKIEKYSKNWEWLGVADVKNCNTIIPFDAGACRMDEYNGTLFISTAHEMYQSDDGLNHQANMGIEVNINTMQITYSRHIVWNSQIGYVSHSFNQFIEVENDYVYTVDHGDAYPRGVVLFKRKVGQTYVEKEKTVLPIAGGIGDNRTGVTVGGFELSANNCLIAGSTVEQSESNWKYNGVKNIFVTVTSKSDFSNSKTVYLTNYTSDSSIKTQNPHLVKINENKFAVLWVETTGKIKMVLINENGEILTDTYVIDGYLSDCKPIVKNETLYWYVARNNKVNLYEVDTTKLQSIIGVELPATMTIEKDETKSLTAKILPENHDLDETLTWSSNQKLIATVDDSGNITGVETGTAIIEVETSNGKNAFCTVTVEEKLEFTTLPVKTVDTKDIIVFPAKNKIETVTTEKNFPVMKKQYVVEFYNESNVVKNSKDNIGSKNVIKIKDKNGNVAKEFIAVVNGDINGDGNVQMYDSFQILKGAIVPGTKLDAIDTLIRDFNNDSYVLLYDAFQFLKQAIIGT